MLFLQSDLKYEWHLPDSAPILSTLARLFRAACPRSDHEEPAGEDVWPFVSVADLERALATFDDDPSGTS